MVESGKDIAASVDISSCIFFVDSSYTLSKNKQGPQVHFET